MVVVAGQVTMELLEQMRYVFVYMAFLRNNMMLMESWLGLKPSLMMGSEWRAEDEKSLEKQWRRLKGVLSGGLVCFEERRK